LPFARGAWWLWLVSPALLLVGWCHEAISTKREELSVAVSMLDLSLLVVAAE